MTPDRTTGRSRQRTFAALAAAGVTAAGLGSGTAMTLGQEDPASTTPETTASTTETTPTSTATTPGTTETTPAPGPSAPDPAPAPAPAPAAPSPGPAPAPAPDVQEPKPEERDDRPHAGDVPTVTGGGEQAATRSKKTRKPARDRTPETAEEQDAEDEVTEAAQRAAERRAKARARRLARERAAERRRRERGERTGREGGAGAPRLGDGDFALSVPGAAPVGVPDFFIEKFRIPPFLLPIYQAAGIQYGIRWELLAAINEIETDYGRNLNVSSAGAEGWMQFMPATWKAYGVDANGDGKKDPYNPVDAIFAAARYLRAAGGEEDVRKAVFAYNHADWYVDSVLMRARLIGGLPADLVGSLTGLTEGRFPVQARATYGKAKQSGRRQLDVFAREGSPVVAVQDGEVVGKGRNAELGTYVKLRDVYGNTYTYAHLGTVEARFPAPRRTGRDSAAERPVAEPARDPKPTQPASGGAQPPRTPAPKPAAPPEKRVLEPAAGATGGEKERVFAHPERARSWKAGGDRQAGTPTEGEYTPYAQRLLGLPRSQVVLKQLRVGATVPAGTVLARIGAGTAKRGSHLRFRIRPAGEGAPQIDPKPILDGWKLLESTAIYRAAGRNALVENGAASVGRVLLERKELLQRRVLADPRIDIDGCGRKDVAAGLIDRRVLATLSFLSLNGLRPTVTSLRCDHGYYTASGNVSAHSSGNAVDIGAINGVRISPATQGPGSITELTIRRLLQLQGTMRPNQIISLMTFAGADNAFSLPDHGDHIHVGFSPTGPSSGGAVVARARLKPSQWDDLVDRLNAIELPAIVRPVQGGAARTLTP